ncbi:MAG: response regulator transcription factor [Planctomycetia bacterium]|jgi:DNA-binding NarL/FixJ family response regulator
MRKTICIPTQKSQCLIIDRQPLWRTTLALALEAAWPAVHVETTGFHGTLLKWCMEIKPDFVIMDIYPEKDGYAIELAAKLRRKIDCQIIFLDQQITLARVQKVLQADVGSYYTYDCPFGSLLEGIRQALDGKISFCPGLSPHLSSSRHGEGLELHVKRQGTDLEVLTEREFEVLHHLAGGMNIKECAEQLQISRKTVDVHKTRIMSKLRVHSHHALVDAFRKSQLFELPRCS